MGKFSEKVKKVWNSVIHNPSFTVKEQLGFSSGIMGNSMAQDVEAFALTLFLTKYMGISAAYVLVLQAVTKIVNIIADPVAGWACGMTTKKGKSITKMFTLITPIPLAVSSVLLFVVPRISLTMRIVYVTVFYLIYIIADAFFDLALLTTSARMTRNPNDRKNFYTVSQFASTLGGMLPSGLIPVFVSIAQAKGKEDRGVYTVFALIFGILGLFLMMIPYFTLEEKTQEKWRDKNAGVKLNFKALWLNRPMWMLICSQITDSIRQICYGGLTYFYIETLDSFWMASVAGTISATLSYVGIALIPIIGKKISARDIIMFGYIYTGAFYVLFLLTGYHSLWIVALIIGLAGFPNGGMSAARKILLADSTDYMEYMTWKKYGEPVRNESMVFAFNSMASRISGLWKSLLLPAGLVVIGYVSAKSFGTTTINVVQSESTLNGIFYLIVFAGIAGNFIPALFMFFDNYHGKHREKILEELNEMRAAKQAEWEKANGGEMA